MGRQEASWIARRRFRYKYHGTLPFEAVRDALKTGDIILFHKTTRSGLLDTIELDFITPLFFPNNEFRHCGIIVRREDELFVLECTEQSHSGRNHARYLTGGTGIREVPLEPLLHEYNLDNGDPHFGVRHISTEIALDDLMEVVSALGPVSYLKGHRSVPIWLSQYVLPRRILNRVIDLHAHQMMCSEFVHRVLSGCGVLREFPSKLFAPYVIENAQLFRRHEVSEFSEVRRFTYSPVG